MNVPLTHWAHGSGAVLSLFLPFVKNDPDAAKVAGFVFTLLLSGFLLSLLWSAAGGDIALFFFGLSLLFAGTQFGLYSFTYGMESLSFMPLAGMLYWLISRKTVGALDGLVLGLFSYLLIIIRLQLFIYCLPVFCVVAFRIAKDKTRLLSRRNVGAVLLYAIPVMVAIWQVGWVNKWMTGSFLASPYSFGAGDFRSFDFKHPNFMPMLIHPWHGLLSYHPLYGLGFILLLGLLFATPSAEKKLFLALSALVMLFHAYIYAAWYSWWSGLWSFGMRGLGLWLILLLPASLAFIRKMMQKRSPIAAALVGISAAFSLWSFFILLQHDKGYPQFYTYAQLLKGQGGKLLVKGPELILYTSAIIVGLMLIARGKRRVEGQKNGLVSVAGAFLFLYLFFLVETLTTQKDGLLKSVGWLRPILLVLVGTTITLALGYLIRVSREGRTWIGGSVGGKLKKAGTIVVPAFLVIVFLVSTFFFIRLQHRTAASIKAGRVPDLSRFTYQAAVSVEETYAVYKEYLRVPGFNEEKERLRKYVEKLIEVSAIPRQDVR